LFISRLLALGTSSYLFSRANYLEFSLDAFFSNFQRIRDLEDKTDIQKRQIKDLEEKVGSIMLLKHAYQLFLK